MSEDYAGLNLELASLYARIAELEAEVARLIAVLEAKTTTGEKEIARLEAEARRYALSTEELNDD